MHKVPKTLRLTKSEKLAVSKKAIEINKILINSNRAPMKESEILHKALDLSLKRLIVDENGNCYIGEE